MLQSKNKVTGLPSTIHTCVTEVVVVSSFSAFFDFSASLAPEAQKKMLWSIVEHCIVPMSPPARTTLLETLLVAGLYTFLSAAVELAAQERNMQLDDVLGSVVTLVQQIPINHTLAQDLSTQESRLANTIVTWQGNNGLILSFLEPRATGLLIPWGLGMAKPCSSVPLAWPISIFEQY